MLKVYDTIDYLEKAKKSTMSALDRDILEMACGDLLDDIANTDMEDIDDLQRIVRCTADFISALYDECVK